MRPKSLIPLALLLPACALAQQQQVTTPVTWDLTLSEPATGQPMLLPDGATVTAGAATFTASVVVEDTSQGWTLISNGAGVNGPDAGGGGAIGWSGFVPTPTFCQGQDCLTVNLSGSTPVSASETYSPLGAGMPFVSLSFGEGPTDSVVWTNGTQGASYVASGGAWQVTDPPTPAPELSPNDWAVGLTALLALLAVIRGKRTS